MQTTLRSFFTGPNFTRWIITVVIGIGVAASAQLIQFLISFISGVRNDFLQSWIDDELSATAWSGGESTALSRASAVAILFTSYNALLVLVASIFTAYLEPITATDGIAEIKVLYPLNCLNLCVGLCRCYHCCCLFRFLFLLPLLQYPPPAAGPKPLSIIPSPNSAFFSLLSALPPPLQITPFGLTTLITCKRLYRSISLKCAAVCAHTRWPAGASERSARAGPVPGPGCRC
jgi:hypothetical protein